MVPPPFDSRHWILPQLLLQHLFLHVEGPDQAEEEDRAYCDVEDEVEYVQTDPPAYLPLVIPFLMLSDLPQVESH